jgi:cytidylate kinase
MEKAFKSEKFRNITISSRAACGATTLSKFLVKKLGWKLLNGGELVREYVKKNGIPLEKTTDTPDGFHINLDEFIKNKLKKENNLIIESWLSGFDAKGIQGIYKILLECFDDSVRIDRLVNRDRMTIEEAKYHLKTREEENIAKWEKLYCTRNFWDPKNYDLVIDTYKNGPTETLDLALKGINYS